MCKKYFSSYGDLSSITPEQYYAGPWMYVCTESDMAGNEWDIVCNMLTGDYAYTTV